MAEMVVVNKEQFEAGLTATADAIRGKTGDSALIKWFEDTGFADAVNAIKNTDISNLRGIVFYDCYGEVVYTHSIN